MAEALMKKLYPGEAYVQSAGVHSDLDVDGFAVAVCEEMGMEIHRHQARSFDDLKDWGDDISSYDLIIALSPASQRRVLDLTRFYHLEVEYWPIMDPTGIGETRDAKLDAYRQARDQILKRMLARFGPSTATLNAL
ncbi:arsenate-mycothiol transferase ArsC [Celeribacter litoreus]|uniref:arsenate-mycothiol transferase ArsC n=1 Tax=Celeribacter litoreus TaxID=2876714 RepID=UPI0021E224E7|nr:low molecular weight phosphatase family protein [Celeribacter litoreus]